MFTEPDSVRRQRKRLPPLRPWPGSRWRPRLLAILSRGAVIAAVALLVLGCRASAQPVPMNQDSFTAYVLEQFQRAAPKIRFRVQAPLRVLVGSGKQTHTLYLDNIYSVCVRNIDGCNTEVSGFVSRMTAFYTTPQAPLDRAMLRVVIRPAAYVEQMRQVMALQGGPAVTPLAGGLWLVAVFDLPTTMQMANLRVLEGLGLSADEALSLGKQNLLAEMRQQIDAAVAGDHAAIMALTGGDYATTLFAFPELWAPIAKSLHGHLVAAVPSSDALLFGDDAVPGMVARLAEAARSVMAGARRPFSDTVFHWSPNGWTPPPP